MHARERAFTLRQRELAEGKSLIGARDSAAQTPVDRHVSMVRHDIFADAHTRTQTRTMRVGTTRR